MRPSEVTKTETLKKEPPKNEPYKIYDRFTSPYFYPEVLVCVKCGRELPACLSHVVSVPDFRTDPGFERFQVVKQILVRVTEANLKIQIRIIIRFKFERAGSVDRI